MDRVSMELSRFAQWFQQTVFPRKRERNSEPIQAPLSNGDLQHTHRQKRRKSVIAAQGSPSNSSHPPAPARHKHPSTRPAPHGKVSRKSPSTTEISFSHGPIGRKQTMIQFPQHPNLHRFGRSRPIVKPTSSEATASTSQTQPMSALQKKTSLSPPPQPSSSSLVPPISPLVVGEAKKQASPSEIPIRARPIEKRWKSRKRTSSVQSKAEAMQIIQESEAIFMRAKVQLKHYMEKKMPWDVDKMSYLYPTRTKTLRYSRPMMWKSDPINVPAPAELPSPVLFASYENFTPVADRKMLDFAEKLLPLLKQAENGRTQIAEIEDGQKISILQEQDYAFYKSISQASPEHVFFELDNCSFVTHDLNTLLPGQWLNDNIINGYMKLLQMRDHDQDHDLSCHYCKTFLINSLFPNYNYKNVRRWTLEKKLKNWGQRKSAILDCDYIFFPVHLDVHWVLAVAEMSTKIIRFYDSLASYLKPDLKPLLENIARYLVDEAKDKKGTVWNISDFTLTFVDDSPRQENGSDCGVFVARNAKEISNIVASRSSNKDIESLKYSVKEMADFRILILKELSTRRIL